MHLEKNLQSFFFLSASHRAAAQPRQPRHVWYWGASSYLEVSLLGLCFALNCRRSASPWRQTPPGVGWVSTDRSVVAALLRTAPSPKAKSSTNDLTPPRRMGWRAFRTPPSLTGGAVKTFCCGSICPRGRIVASRPGRCDSYRRISGRDSDLEAFSHNPSDGSLAPLAYQPST